MRLPDYVRSIPDFPKQGINFKDITTLLKDPAALQEAVLLLKQHYAHLKVNKVIGIESRGFIIGSALAVACGAGFVPIRKKGKLPAQVIREDYALEYGIDTIEMHMDAVQPNDRVLMHDDLLATGGTMVAAVRLVEKLQAHVVGISFLIELTFLKGRERMKNYDIFSLIQFDKE
jgi:adenine phosphoribosyltransferase